MLVHGINKNHIKYYEIIKVSGLTNYKNMIKNNHRDNNTFGQQSKDNDSYYISFHLKI